LARSRAEPIKEFVIQDPPPATRAARTGLVQSRGSGSWESTLAAGELAAIRSAGFLTVGRVTGAAVYALPITAEDRCPGTTAKLYSPPKGALPILMAAGGLKSAQFAGTYADGLITSVKNPAETVQKVIAPYRAAATAVGKEHQVLATRWTVVADGGGPAPAALLVITARGAKRSGSRSAAAASCQRVLIMGH
jgi:hypothetical protein